MSKPLDRKESISILKVHHLPPHTYTSTQDQYFFIHEALAEALVCGDTEVAMEDLPEYTSELGQVIAEDEHDTTYIELEFKVCT